MSIFKAKEWWSNNSVQDVTLKEGEQNSSCLKVDKFNLHGDSDCIIIAEGSLLKIYKPCADPEASLLIEVELSQTVLQVETGKFVVNTDDRQILVLHPQSYFIYQLNKQDGHSDAGVQHSLKLVIKHAFTRRASSLTCGPFGNIKTRDLICVQGLDGSLSFFDQDSFLFICVYNDIIIPGPVNYIASADCFVICKSTWVMEIYSYQQLREFSDLNRQTKKNIPQWTYNGGEEISSVQVIQTSSNFSTVVALGERHLYSFQDNGLMKYMIKFNYKPICFCAYLIGWYYEPTSRLLVMVGSEDTKMYVYEGTKLLWSCDLLHTAISISRCFLKSLSGGVVTLSNNGVISITYLGTEPDLNANLGPTLNDNSDPEQVQAELESVEQELQKIFNNTGGVDDQLDLVLHIFNFRADVGKPVQNLFQEFAQDHNAGLHLLMCSVVVMLTCQQPEQIVSIQLTYACPPPFTCTEPVVCLDNINGTEIVESQVFVASEAEISETIVKIICTIIGKTGKITVLTHEILLPLSLYCTPTEKNKENLVKLHLLANYPCTDFSKIFTDFTDTDLQKHGSSIDLVTFSSRTTKKKVTVRATADEYIIEANDFSEITSILKHFIIKLTDHHIRMGVKDFKVRPKIDGDFAKLLTHKFLKSVESHAKERLKLKTLEDELKVLEKQFNLIQKRLLVQYGSLPPGDCDPLEFLMKDTHKMIITSVNDIISTRENVCRAGSVLCSVGNLMIFIFRHTKADVFKINLIEDMLSFSSLYEQYQEWEEAVTQSLPYILNNVFQKSEKDKEKLAPVTEQGVLSHVNLKRFIKQLRIIFDNMFSEALGEDETNTTNEHRVTRIEEMVEVI